MNRRRFLASSALAAGAALSSAGCLGFGGGSNAPPRRSSVFTDVQATEQGLVLQLPDRPWVQTRADVGGSGKLERPDSVGFLGGLSPVGVARGAKGGGGAAVGATGRGQGGAATAPPSTNGYSKWHGGDGDDYDDWRENHDDEVRKHDASIAAVGLAYLGSQAAYADDPPPAGPVDWDRTVESVDGREVVWERQPQSGWYRSGAHLVAADADHDFGWECIDCQVEAGGSGPTVDTVWKVSPRL